MQRDSSRVSQLYKWLLQANRHSDIYLALLVVMVISLIIIPIPIWLLDGLIAVNLTTAITLLMVTLYIPRVLAFSSFPSILLFTTLFRLSLNITTTRNILLKADAGQIIQTFGEFVVAGNFVVGVVVFLIILIVQFIVITKGAERVAEVAARFTLDAMPGKQMSIDADLRAGTIEPDEARARRSELERENQLYGAMDGAMKFVKGDAIASLIITAINIVAGLGIGIVQKGMSVGDAITTYSILTIGDGLVSQIPALLISMTAGIVVTRVGSDSTDSLGREIFGQILSQPKAILIASCLLVAFAFIPGFPTITFLILALGTFLIGHSFFRKQVEDAKAGDKQTMDASAPARSAGKPPGEAREFDVAIPLLIEASSTIKKAIDPAAFNQRLIEVRQALYYDLGVPFPGIRLRYSDTCPENEYQVLLNEVPTSQGHIRQGSIMVQEDTALLQGLHLQAEEEKSFLPGLRSVWVPDSAKDKLASLEIGYMTIPDLLCYHITFVLRRYAKEFIGIQETRFLMDNLGETYSEVVQEVQRILPLQKITEVLQRLVQEEISIRDLRTILQTLIEWGPREKEGVLLTEYCRSRLARYISYRYSAGQNILPVYLLAPEVEDTIRKAIRSTSSGSYLALDTDTAKQIIEQFKEQVAKISPGTSKPVVLTAMDIRRYLRKLLELEIYDLAVISHQELTEEISVQPLARIEL